MPTLTTLVAFNGANGANPHASLIADTAGNLYGTTEAGGANNDGSVFEIANTTSGYASTPTTLVSFNGTNGTNPYGNLTVDGAGDLFGTTENGGANGYGTIFEIIKSGSSFAGATIVATINPVGGLANDGTRPFGGLISDAAGNLYGTTEAGGTSGGGTVFELGATRGIAVAPTTLVSFSASGNSPFGNVVMDHSGNLFGTTMNGGTAGEGAVFEIPLANGSYASTATILTSFTDPNGGSPFAGLTIDSSGNLIGTTRAGGPTGSGTIFEIAKTGTGYASTPTTLASFNGTNGFDPAGGVIADANGNLYGTTLGGGVNGDGTVFELAFSNGAYATTPTTLATFGGANGATPYAGLVSDANGNLFGTTTSGGATGNGTVFELTGTGFAPVASTAPSAISIATPILALYDAALGRLPDLAGGQFWGNLYAANPASLSTSIAASFISSSEFQAKYGALGPTAFVNQLYENVLNRPADSSGLAFWSGELTSNAMNQAQVLVGFAESSENLANYNGTSVSLTATGTNVSIGGIGAKNIFAPGDGTNAITGGPGVDTLIFSGTAGSYTVTQNSDGSLTVSNSSVTDHVSGVGYLQFSDGHTIIATDANDVPIAALYQAAFGRTPDVLGMQYWEGVYTSDIPASVQAGGLTTALAQYTPAGLSASIAASFIASTEFQTAYGALAPAAFVNQLYENVLGREPDPSGAQFWTGELTSGAMTQAMVLVGIADSTENLAKYSGHAILVA